MEKLTNKEEEVMQALWKLGKAFVKELVATLSSDNHYNTISTVVRNLEEKGYVSYDIRHALIGKLMFCFQGNCRNS